MKKFYMSLVNHRKTMLMICTMVFVVCLLLGNLVEVNYDINDYLPESSPSTVSLPNLETLFVKIFLNFPKQASVCIRSHSGR